MKSDIEENTSFKKSDFSYDKETCCYIPSNLTKQDIIDSFRYSDGEKIENKILKILKNANDISYNSEELMGKVSDWPSLYHLGIGRANTIDCLNIENNVNVLEIGAGCGAITRYLGENFSKVLSIEGNLVRATIARERCRDLNNVQMVCSNLNELDLEETYDVVIAIGVLEYAPIYIKDKKNPRDACLKFIKLAKSFLNKDGILITAIENKIGIKYWSGCSEDHTGRIFEGIHDYPNPNTPITFSKKELKDLLKQSGLANNNYYYCFPDYKFATTILSDIDINKNLYLHNWVSTPFKHFGSKRNHYFHEGLAIKTLYQSNLLKKFANSFLVVSNQSNTKIHQPSNWIVKKYSLNRRKEFQTSTTLKYTPKILVEKERLNSRHEVKRISNKKYNLEHRISKNEWIKGDLLIFKVYKILQQKDFRNNLKELFKRYVKELKNNYFSGACDEKNFTLLKGNAIDYIFSNLIETNGRMICIDDEWNIKNNIPIDFVLYRCIRQTIETQGPWIKDKIKNQKKFRISLIKTILPNYNNKRDIENSKREQTFQNLGAGNLREIKFNNKSLNKIKENKSIMKIWRMLPRLIKVIIRKLINV